VRNFSRLIALCCALLFVGDSQAQTARGNAQSVANPALRRELLQRLERDQSIRNELIKKGVARPEQSLLDRMHAIDAENAARMRAIVRQYGWPSPSLVGRDGAEAAFTLVQHADPAFQKEMLPLVRKAYKRSDLSGQDYALLLDRVLVGEGKPQVYGTQTKPIDQWKGEEPEFAPIEDKAKVDQRRAKVGLFPLSEYREMLKRM
jgi:hypothetical protein